MKSRQIIITADSLLEIMKDYAGADNIAPDAKLVRLMFKPTDKGKFAFVVETGPEGADRPPIEIRYDIQRIFEVGG